MKINFTPPKIIGAICEAQKDVPRGLFASFSKLKPRIAFLPFQVKKKYLGNTIACMKLMDIDGLVVCGVHRREIARHLPSLDPIAKKTGEVDLVIRKGRKFKGVNISALAFTKNSCKPKVLFKTQMGIFCQRCVEFLTKNL